MDAEAVLSCEPFDLQLAGLRLQSDGFRLPKGTINVMHGMGGSGINEFLMLLAGLQTARMSSRPATGASIVREKVSVPLEDLRFLKLYGEPIHEIHPEERVRRIGFVFENPELFTVGRTVLEDFQYTFAATKQDLPEPQGLRAYDLYEKRHRHTELLSGGEQHRLNCASVLEMARDLIIADFSYSNLDPDFLDVGVKWFRERAERGTTILVHGLPQLLGPERGGISLMVMDGRIRVATDRPADLFPDLVKEKEILETLYGRRAGSGKTILDIKHVGRMDGVTQPASFTVSAGEVVQLRGPNGCGKTSLGRMIAGQLRDYVGEIWKRNGLRPSLCLQFPERLFIEGSVFEEIPDENLRATLDLTGSELAGHPRKLGRAKQKLLGAAVALSHGRGLTVLDEPTSGMDFPTKKTFMKLLAAHEDQAVIIINHDPALFDVGRVLKWEDITT